jgi:hypothetical protein
VSVTRSGDSFLVWAWPESDSGSLRMVRGSTTNQSNPFLTTA